jgi:hypothetical protein
MSRYSVTEGWTEAHKRLVVPDQAVTPERGDQLVPLRGWGAALAVLRDDKPIGYVMAPEECTAGPRASWPAKIIAWANSWNLDNGANA